MSTPILPLSHKRPSYANSVAPYYLPQLANPADEWWREYGKCKNSLEELFFPEECLDNGEIRFLDNDPQATSAARTICHSCPVQSSCLDWALRSNEFFGVWGGLTPRNRRRLSLIHSEIANIRRKASVEQAVIQTGQGTATPA